MATSETNMICVGGPMHGQRKKVEAGRDWWECVERPRVLERMRAIAHEQDRGSR